MTIARSWRAPIVIALVVVLLDQTTKHWAVNALADGHIIDVIWTLQFNLAYNSGMAFSRGRGLGPIIAVVATMHGRGAVQTLSDTPATTPDFAAPPTAPTACASLH